MAKVTAWIVMSIPGDERTPTDWYVFNRETLQQIGCDDRDDACRVVAELRLARN